MSYAFVQQKASSTASSAQGSIASGSFSSGVAAGNALAWWVQYFHASAEQTVSLAGNSNTYTEVGHFYDSNQYGLRWGYAKNVNSGTTGATATFGANVDAPSILLQEFSGLDTVNIFNSGEQIGLYTGAPGTGTDGWTSGTVTPANQPAAVLGIAVQLWSAAMPLVAGTGFTARAGVWDFGYGVGNLGLPIDKRITSLSAVAATWTATSGGGGFGPLAMMILREQSAANAKAAARYYRG